MVQSLTLRTTLHLCIQLTLVLIVCAAALYVYFLCSSIHNVVVRKELERDIATLSSSIGELEFTYFQLQSSLDGARVEELGLTALQEKGFTPRSSLSLTLNR
jgi:hypothetical protein